MTEEDAVSYLEKALASLKDFQRSSVEVLQGQFAKKEVRSMLVADEVGLGKTVVAKGLLASILLERIAAGNPSPLKVTYICSNQVIAEENLRKLQLFPDQTGKTKSISRISFLATKQTTTKNHQSSNLLEVNTLTPATSFKIRNSTGVKGERALIYGLLCKDPSLRENSQGLGWLLRGQVNKMREFRHELKEAAKANFQEDLPARFIKALHDEKIPTNSDWIYDNLSGTRERSLYQIIQELTRDLKGSRETEVRYNACYEICLHLRRILIRCCLDYVDADLYILDEFQRFRDLIDNESEEEQALIARQIFGQEGTKILLLSATPFKAFTGQAELANGEEHFADFRRVLSFLLDNDEVKLANYDFHRSELYRQLLTLRPGRSTLDSFHREQVENILRSRICRTERHLVSNTSNSLVTDSWKKDQLPFGPGDIHNFTRTDAVVKALQRVAHIPGKPVEFCKSALYPLSYLDKYELKKKLKANKEEPKVAKVLRKSKPAWLDFEQINDYSWDFRSSAGKTQTGNARLKMLADKAIGKRGAELLWLPPSLPYYPLESCFAEEKHFTKTLLFSSWVMVPRMAATLLSYEVERQTIANPKSRTVQEKGERIYFEKARRSPIPQITFGPELANMSNFTLLYPSQTLAAAVLPLMHLGSDLSLGELKALATKRIQALIEQHNLDQYVKRTIGGERWYWAAPLLLDRATADYNTNVEDWAEGESESWNRETFFETRDNKPGAKEDHAEEFVRVFEEPETVDFGPLPSDLAEVLADLALGSPAIIALRSLQQLFPKEDIANLMVHAFQIAEQFIELFNKPESIAAIRLSTPAQPYWRMSANYSSAGCLQAVLDEYFHLLKGQNLNLTTLMQQVREAINLTSSSIKADSLDSFLAGESRNMRCHYATVFGNQDLEHESGQKRATGLREVFNSPFRPFVLASTSIGQEGLDFHSYCRRIVHWNLPSNPIDLEQREGRINRYKSLVIRQHVAHKYRALLASEGNNITGDVWDRLFSLAKERENTSASSCDLVPYWHVDTDEIKIERIIPNYPFSQDQNRLEKILKTLAIYRLAFGQPRQEELVDHLLKQGFTEEELEQVRKNLIVNLCPMSYRPQ